MTSPIPASETAIQDLRAHIKDWKGHSLDTLGLLFLREVLTVHRASQTKEYDVHVFEKALIFVTKGTEEEGKRVLHLKGRLFMNNIMEASKFISSEKMAVTIRLDQVPQDQALVTLVFKDERTLNRWRDFIVFLAAQARAAPAAKVQAEEDCTATGTVSEKHVISQAGQEDIESQIQAVEKPGQVAPPPVQSRRWGMVGMILFCILLQGLLLLQFLYQNVNFIEADSE